MAFPYKVIDLTDDITENIPFWHGGFGFSKGIVLDYKDYQADVKFRVQKLISILGLELTLMHQFTVRPVKNLLINYPYVSCAEFLVEREIADIGVDTLSPDRPSSGLSGLKILFKRNIYILENIANPLKRHFG